MNLLQAMARAVEVRGHETRRLQAAVEPVGPAMIGAGEGFSLARGFPADARAAMPAHVHERAENAILAAHEDRGLAGDLDQLEIAGVRQAALVAGAEPVAHQHALDIAAEDLGIAVERLLQRMPRGLSRDQRRDLRIRLAFPNAAVVHREKLRRESGSARPGSCSGPH